MQLRNLVWALSRNDVLVVRDNCVVHWSPATRTATEVLSLAGGGRGARATGLGRVQVRVGVCICGLCVRVLSVFECRWYGGCGQSQMCQGEGEGEVHLVKHFKDL